MKTLRKPAIPCICGHSRTSHKGWGHWKVCMDPLIDFEECECDKYVPDNLSYIEKLAKKKKLV